MKQTNNSIIFSAPGKTACNNAGGFFLVRRPVFCRSPMDRNLIAGCGGMTGHSASAALSGEWRTHSGRWNDGLMPKVCLLGIMKKNTQEASKAVAVIVIDPFALLSVQPLGTGISSQQYQPSRTGCFYCKLLPSIVRLKYQRMNTVLKFRSLSRET